jgi:hypothetical protein
MDEQRKFADDKGEKIGLSATATKSFLANENGWQ